MSKHRWGVHKHYFSSLHYLLQSKADNMIRVCLFVLTATTACLNVCQAKSAVNSATEPFGYCIKSTPISNCTTDILKADWLLLYSSNIQSRNGASYWGGDFPYDFCDAYNQNSGCMALGFSYVTATQNKLTGYSYAYNAFTDVWTIAQVNTNIVKVPGTDLVGFRESFTHYTQFEDKAVFNNGTTPQPCGSKVLRSGPIYRSTNFVILTAASDFSWIVLLHCDSFYGFVGPLYGDDSPPLIQVVVKRDIIDKCSYPFNTLFFYKEIKEAILKNNLNVYASDFKLIYHDQGGVYPTAVNWDSIQWDADCVCATA
ncbi:hypothetical protein M8J75_002663 [Diaphorina citri]|nr:hypothetical protein M8J75_002663 [Diaphorina citri]KAI5752155.1 hypothetical protein M8J77_014354 [Diaphorina citri]